MNLSLKQLHIMAQKEKEKARAHFTAWEKYAFKAWKKYYVHVRESSRPKKRREVHV